MQYEKASLRRCFFDAVCPAKLDYTCRCKSGHGNRRLSRKTNDPWTKAEEKILKKYYPVECGNVYKRLNNRTRNACISKAAQLHLQYGLHLRLECDETGKFRVYEDSVLLDEKEYRNHGTLRFRIAGVRTLSVPKRRRPRYDADP